VTPFPRRLSRRRPPGECEGAGESYRSRRRGEWFQPVIPYADASCSEDAIGTGRDLPLERPLPATPARRGVPERARSRFVRSLLSLARRRGRSLGAPPDELIRRSQTENYQTSDWRRIFALVAMRSACRTGGRRPDVRTETTDKSTQRAAELLLLFDAGQPVAVRTRGQRWVCGHGVAARCGPRQGQVVTDHPETRQATDDDAAEGTVQAARERSGFPEDRTRTRQLARRCGWTLPWMIEDWTCWLLRGAIFRGFLRMQ
jgi:hypothetical protein